MIVSLSESCCGTLRSFAGTETGRGRIGKYKKIVPAPHERASRGRQGCWRRAGLGLATNFASANHSRWRLNLCVARDAAGGRATRADGWVDAAQAVWPSSQPFHHHRALERPRRTGGRAGRPLLCSNEVGGPSVNGVERFQTGRVTFGRPFVNVKQRRAGFVRGPWPVARPVARPAAGGAEAWRADSQQICRVTWTFPGTRRGNVAGRERGERPSRSAGPPGPAGLSRRRLDEQGRGQGLVHVPAA